MKRMNWALLRRLNYPFSITMTSFLFDVDNLTFFSKWCMSWSPLEDCRYFISFRLKNLKWWNRWVDINLMINCFLLNILMWDDNEDDNFVVGWWKSVIFVTNHQQKRLQAASHQQQKAPTKCEVGEIEKIPISLQDQAPAINNPSKLW